MNGHPSCSFDAMFSADFLANSPCGAVAECLQSVFQSGRSCSDHRFKDSVGPYNFVVFLLIAGSCVSTLVRRSQEIHAHIILGVKIPSIAVS